jgi:hypothetical protein
MCALSASDLLNLWDSGRGRDHTTRALLLLGADDAAPDLPDLPIGERDRRLFDLRRRIFGSRIESVEPCPSCQARLEIAFELDDVRVAHGNHHERQFTVEMDGFRLDVRLPTSRDLLAIRDRSDLDDARRALLTRCVAGIDGTSPLSDPARIPEPVLEALSRTIAEHDPQAEVLLDLRCANCGHAWQRHFDIVEYIWTEIDRTARRLLRDVHRLAIAYGWSESAILSLSPRRRAIYLGMVIDG